MRPLRTEVDERLWTIFERALEQPEDARQSFVSEACRGDDDLRRALEELLEADARERCFLDSPLVEVNSSLDEADGSTAPTEPARCGEPPVEQLGPWRLAEKIGEGGMGIVYRAERDDQAFERSVVVKIARSGPGDDERMRRLRIERRILARLEHPGVARLYDGGTTSNHRPWFVMEYVDGEPIDVYCEQHRLSIADRLALFRKVCAAVSYAHRNLVVHRDLKPSNILVTPEGEPRLLDFGIAKLLDLETEGEEGEQTHRWQRVLTPRYASPEQLRGEAVTTTSDVYSLGVLLYKLLTGVLPHDFKGYSIPEIARLVEERPPARPSVVTGGDTGRQLRGDLDSILLQALRPDPRGRYRSVEKLDDEIERYQRGLPVSARRETWLYLSGKFARRHGRAVTAASLFLALILAFAGAMAWQSARVARERDQVSAERDKAESVLEYLREVLRFDDPKVSRDERGQVTLREALELSMPRLDALHARQPESAAALFHELGVTWGHLGQFEPAREQLEKALTTRRAHLGDRHPDVAESLLALADVLKESGESGLAERSAREAVAIFREQLDASDPELVRPLNHLVSVLCWAEDYERAEPHAAEALTLARQLAGDDPKHPVAINNLAAVRSAFGDSAAAVELYRESIELLRAGWSDSHPDLPALLNNLGVELRQLEDFDGAEGAYREALRLQRRILGKEHPDLSFTYYNLAGALDDLGQHTDAAISYVQALQILRNVLPGEHPRIFLVELRLALSRAHAGEPHEAAGDLRRQLEAWRPRLGSEHPRIARAESILGEILMLAGDLQQAEALLTESYRKLLEVGKRRHRKEALLRLEALHERLGREIS